MAKRSKKKDPVHDLEQFLAHRYTLPGETLPSATDVFTGEEFTPRAANHYEFNDGVPHAPVVDMPRLTLRERVQRLQGAGVDLDRYLPDDSDELDFEDPEDNEPLTRSEDAYIRLNEHIDFVQAQPQDGGSKPPAPPSPPAAPPEAPEPPKSGGAGGPPPAKAGS